MQFGPSTFDSDLDEYLKKTHITEMHNNGKSKYHSLDYSSIANNGMISEIIIGSKNPFTVDDIKRYLKKNNIDCKVTLSSNPLT